MLFLSFPMFERFGDMRSPYELCWFVVDLSPSISIHFQDLPSVAHPLSSQSGPVWCSRQTCCQSSVAAPCSTRPWGKNGYQGRTCPGRDSACCRSSAWENMGKHGKTMENRRPGKHGETDRLRKDARILVKQSRELKKDEKKHKKACKRYKKN